MNEIILSNSAMPIAEECALLAASEPFLHLDRPAPSYNVLIYVLEGTIYVTEDETDYEINSGEMFFLKSGIHHYGKKEISRGTRWYYIHFRDGIAPGHNEECNITLPKKLAVSPESRIINSLKRYVDFYYSNAFMTKWHVNSRLYEFLTRIIEYEQPTELTLSDKICAYLTDHYTQQFSVADLEKCFFLSYKHMAAVFRRDKGMTMQQFHTNMRINTACRLLKSTLMPIGEIAEAVGYSDALYFSRRFHAAMGISPTEYRRLPLY